jgi:hypothetical protein
MPLSLHTHRYNISFSKHLRNAQSINTANRNILPQIENKILSFEEK